MKGEVKCLGRRRRLVLCCGCSALAWRTMGGRLRGAGAGACRAVAIALACGLAVAAVFGLSNLPLHNGCKMTYMYPTYIPLPPPANLTTKYGLYLYHEGWQKIDFDLHLLKLSGVPVLFIPGNGGSYKQVRSIAAESERAFNGGPLDESFFRESSLSPRELGWRQSGEAGKMNSLFTDQNGKAYPNHLDWFAVDLDGEHSAMDGRILEEHTEYVVQAVDRILDRYQESITARSKAEAGLGERPPKTVILVGHSMGGFVARAAVVHPRLRKGSVETVLTLSSPHRSPPLALQPSLGLFFSSVNDAWRRGYSVSRTKSKRVKSGPLSKVVVVSIFGGTRDYQVRANLASLEGIVPPTNGVTIGAPEMLNVWLSTEHQSILWCNQLVVQVAHTLLHLIDAKSGQPVSDPRLRLHVFVSKLRTALAKAFDWPPPGTALGLSTPAAESLTDRMQEAYAHGEGQFACPKSIQWAVESQEKDLYIESQIVTILAMDGRRRWLDIRRMVAAGRDWFVMVTNLAPCTGVRLHLWPARDVSLGNSEEAVSHRIKEVTMKFVQLPAGPAPLQTEPGGQSEQAPPSAIIRLSPDELQGFQYLTISVAPQPSLSGRPPPAASMALGQFLNIGDGSAPISSSWIVSSFFKQREVTLRENHPLVTKLSVAASLGMFPMSVSMRTASCGMTEPPQAEGDHSNICKLRCFPPVALVWDASSGLLVLPSLNSETMSVDSSPAIWTHNGVEGTSIVFVADPHCAYNISMKISVLAAAGRFFLTYGQQISGFAVALVLFALMRQARAWEQDQPIPSILACLESNLIRPLSLISLCFGPLLVYLTVTTLQNKGLPQLFSFLLTSCLCYAFASGAMMALALAITVVFHSSAYLHFHLKVRWCTWQESQYGRWLHRLLGRLSLCSSSQVVRKVRGKPTLTVAVLAIVLVLFVHPALGLLVLCVTHAWRCHLSLLRHHGSVQRSKRKDEPTSTNGDVPTSSWPRVAGIDGCSTAEPDLSCGGTQLDLFSHTQGLLLLHLCATAMMFPSLVAWVQRPGWDRPLPSIVDSVLCVGLIVHGLFGSSVNGNTLDMLAIPYFKMGTCIRDMGLSAVYLCAGFCCYLAGLTLVPYKGFYVMAALGLLTAGCRVRERVRGKGEQVGKRRHSRKHRQL